MQAAQSGEESGDAEGSDKSDSDGEEGNEEVNEEEVLEKFIDEGGKLSDLESDSEGGAKSKPPQRPSETLHQGALTGLGVSEKGSPLPAMRAIQHQALSRREIA